MFPPRLRHCGAIGGAFLLMSAYSSTASHAHSGNPAQAPIVEPSCACLTFDQQVPFRWLDSDSPTNFGPATIDFFAIEESPPTFDQGVDPLLGGYAVARGILEPDTTNRAVWNTATVASGHYFLWSRVNEPPEEMSPLFIELSPHVVTVRHNDDLVGPSVVITKPSNSFSVSIGTFQLKYSACDPTGSARVRLEAGLDGDFELLADDLPAVIDGSYTWDTRYVPPGYWTLRATISDGCGNRFVAYGRYYLNVIEPLEPVPDAGPRDAQLSPPLDARSGESCAETWSRVSCEAPDASLDAGQRDAAQIIDAGPRDSGGVEAPGESCGCSATQKHVPLFWLIFAAVLRMRRYLHGPRR